MHAARLVMTAKLAGQQDVARDLPDGEGAAATIGDSLTAVEAAASALNDLLAAESWAAFAYRDAWSRVPPRFRQPRQSRCPGRLFGGVVGW